MFYFFWFICDTGHGDSPLGMLSRTRGLWTEKDLDWTPPLPLRTACPWLCTATLVMPRHTFLSAKLMIIYDITAIKSNIFTIGTEYGKLLRGWLSASGDMNTESLSADNIGSWHLSKLRSNALAVCIAIFSPVCVSPYGYSSGYPIISMPWPCLHSGPLCVWRWR